MTYLSIIEKFKILFNLILDFKFILIFSIFILVFTFVYLIKKMKTKWYIFFTVMTFVIMFAISIITNYNILANTFDNFATIFFQNIYFPSIYVYIGVLISSFIAFIISMVNVNIKRIYKIINSIMCITNNILFVIILNIIAVNQIDVFSINSLYTNTNLVVILELSMGLCLLWILSLTTAYVTNIICDRIAYKKKCKVSDKEMFNPVLEIELSPADDIGNNDNINDLSPSYIYNNGISVEMIEEKKDNNIVANEEEIPENNRIEINTIEEPIEINNIDIEETKETDNIDYVLAIDNSYQNNLVIDCSENIEDNSKLTFNDILNGCVPVTYYESTVESEEYKLFNPQIMYENNYNKRKEEICLNDLLKEDIEVDKDLSTIEDTEEIIESYTELDTKKENELINKYDTEKTEEDINMMTIEEITQIEKEKVSKERLNINTILLSDLNIEESSNKNSVDDLQEKSNEAIILNENEYNNEYTIADYRKVVEMLNNIKLQSISNINIEDAVAISLINNYSVEDCMKFKKLLESNLN